MGDHEDHPVFGDGYDESRTLAITSSADKDTLEDQSGPATAGKLGDVVRWASFSKKWPEESAADSYYVSALKFPEPMSGDVNDSVACPYGCGTVLTGVNAFGNLTRHLKGTGCTATGKIRPAFMCQVDGCGRKYSRSDGLRVHMRRRHGASKPLAKTGLSMGESPVAQGDWAMIQEMAPTQPDVPEQLSQHALGPSHRDVDHEKEVNRWSMPEFAELGRDLEGMWWGSRNSRDQELQDEMIAEDASGPHALPMPIESVPVWIAPHISDTWTSNTSPVTRPPSPPPDQKMSLSLTFEEAQVTVSPSDSAGDNNKGSKNGSGRNRRSRRQRNESMSSPFPMTGHEIQFRDLDSKPDLYEGISIPKRERYRVSDGRANSASPRIDAGNRTTAEVNQVAALLEPMEATFRMPEDTPNAMNRRDPEIWSENITIHDMHSDDESSKRHELEQFPIHHETADDYVLSSPLPHEVGSSKQEAQIMPAADQGIPGRYLKSFTLPVAKMYPFSSSDSGCESEASPPVVVELLDIRHPHTLSEERITQSFLWSPQEEETLLKMRAAGREWEDISINVLPHHSPIACSKRHEWLMESLFNKTAKDIKPSKVDSIRQLCAGLRTPDLATVHHQDHLSSPTVYSCPNEGCAIPGKGFARKRLWRRHVKRCKASIVAHAAREADWAATTPNDHGTYAASNSSSSFSYADSVLSTASLASSATDLSKHSIYSADQIARATKELISILQEDTDLALLYKYAIENVGIGPERLERNLRRLFRGYADLLNQAASETIELVASRLVKLKARAVARSIVQKYDAHERALMIVAKIRSEQDQSSEEENDASIVDESVFEDLVQFREFLVRGEPFTALQTQVRLFVLPRPIGQETSTGFGKDKYGAETSTSTLTATTTKVGNSSAAIEKEGIPPGESTIHVPVSTRKTSGFLQEMTSSVLIALGYLDPPLQNGLIRLRWHCKCGDTFFGDLTEYREGGVARMIERMERTIGSKVVVTSYKQAAAASPRYTFRLPSWMQVGTAKLSSTFGRYTKSPVGLPQHRGSDLTTPCAPQDAELQPGDQTLHLMACMQRGRYRRTVYQDRVDQITTDQALFCFMRNQLAKHRGRIRKIFSMKCVRGMYFVKFRLRAGGSAEVRNHEPCCTSSHPQICECIPPALKVEPSPDAEYRCAPAGPLDTWPPVLSEELMHMLTSPQCINPGETFVLEQLPKRTKGELIGTIGRPAEGWGIHFQEGWDFDLLIGIVLAVFLLASLLFAVLWSHFKLDVQGAFGVSSYMVTASGIFVAWFANRAGKLG